MHADQQALEQSSDDGLIRFDPKTVSRGLWDRFHVFRRARYAEASPDEPVPSDADNEADQCDQDPNGDGLRWVGLDQDRVVTSVYAYLLRPDIPHFAERARFLNAHGAVLTPWRGRGLGTRLIARIHRLMSEHDKTLLTISTDEADGHGFLRHIGASEKICTLEKRLLLRDVDWPQLARWEAAAGAAVPGSSFAHYGPQVSKDIFEALLPTLTVFLRDMPVDELEHAPIRFETRDIDEWQRQLDRQGGAQHLMVCRDGDGSVLGLSIITWLNRTPDRMYQMLTGVRREKRGAGIATGLKAAMLREIRDRYPGVSQLTTSVARSNGPMLSINRKLGFKPHREFGTYQIERAALGDWLARRLS